MAIRLVKCPLCLSKLMKSHLQKSGVCIRCDEERLKNKLAVQTASEASEQLRDRQAHLCYRRFEQGSENRRKAQEAADIQKALDEEHKQMLAIHKDQASIALARRSLLHYIERRIPTYEADWVHELVAMEIERFVNDVENGEAPRLILAMPSRLGKALANQTPILTANRGWTTHGDLKVGDYVFGLAGKPTKIIAIGPEIDDVDLEIEFTNGEKIIAHRQHEWLIFSRPAKKYKIYETQELFVSSVTNKPRVLAPKTGGNVNRGRALYQLPTPACLEYPEAELPAHPYMLSAWLGDGSSRDAVITHHSSEREVIDKLIDLGYERTYAFHHFKAGSCQTRFGRVNGYSRMMEELKAIGVMNNKHIPEVYFSSSREQRLQLLAGAIDTDATKDKNSRITISTCSERLRDDYIRLLRSLGQRPYYSTTPPTLSSSGIQGKKNTYNVGFQPTVDDIPMQLPRKRVHRPVPLQRVGILSIKEVPPQKGRCIQVDAEDHIYLVGETLIPTRNSELASVSAPAWILGQHPNWNVIIASYSDALPTKFSRQIREQLSSEEYHKVFPNGAVLKKDDASAKAWSTEQGGGVRATGVGSGLRGFGANILIMDDVVEDEHAANSPTVMDDVWTFTTSTAYSRLMPKSGVLVIAQRLGADDLIGRFIKKMKAEEDGYNRMLTEANEYEDQGNKEEAAKIRHDAKELWESMDHWRVVKYPALAVADEYLTTDGDIVRAPEHTAIEPSWRLLRREGESIHPKRFSRYYYLNQKRANPLTFQSTFQQEPISEEGAYFNASDFSRRYTPGKHPRLELCSVFCAWDLAISTATSADYTVGIAGAMDHHGDLYLLELIKGRFGDAFVISDLIIDLHLRWKAQITGIEKMMVSMTLGPVLARRMQERKEFIALAEGKDELRTGNQDKKLRARQFQALCRQGKVVTPDTPLWDEYIAHMTQFGASRHDDEVDASAWLGILATRQPPPRNLALMNRPEGKQFTSWYDELLAEIGGQSGSYMEA